MVVWSVSGAAGRTVAGMTLLPESTVASERHVLAAVAGRVIEIGRYTVAVKVARNGGLPIAAPISPSTRVTDGSWRRTVQAFNAGESITARYDDHKEDSP